MLLLQMQQLAVLLVLRRVLSSRRALLQHLRQPHPEVLSPSALARSTCRASSSSGPRRRSLRGTPGALCCTSSPRVQQVAQLALMQMQVQQQGVARQTRNTMGQAGVSCAKQ
jgi:hypothetical protein